MPQSIEMPGEIIDQRLPKKRKRPEGAVAERSSKKRPCSTEDDDQHSQILLLENQILESRQHYNSIPTLLSYVEKDNNNESNVVAAVALCRVFCRLMAAGNMTKAKESSQNDLTIILWLLERCRDFNDALLRWLKCKNFSEQSTAMTLILRLIREEANFLNRSDHDIWASGAFIGLVDALLESEDADLLRVEFIKRYANQYDDVRYHTFSQIGYVVIDAYCASAFTEPSQR